MDAYTAMLLTDLNGLLILVIGIELFFNAINYNENSNKSLYLSTASIICGTLATILFFIAAYYGFVYLINEAAETVLQPGSYEAITVGNWLINSFTLHISVVILTAFALIYGIITSLQISDED